MTKTILLVDDDPMFQYIHKCILMSLDKSVEIRLACNGQMALVDIHASIEGQHRLPDCILIDFHMPIMDGRGFLEVFRSMIFKEKENIRLIVASSIPAFTELECQYYNVTQVIKPLNHEYLQRILEQKSLQSSYHSTIDHE